MTIEQFKKATPKELKEYGNTLPLGNTYDDKENVLTQKKDNQFWTECTYDEESNLTTFKDSYGVYVIKDKEVYNIFVKEMKNDNRTI